MSGNHFYSCALCTHFTAKYSENVFYANICTKNVQTPVLTVQVVRRCVFMVRMVYVVDQIGSEQTVSRDSFNYAREVKAADMSNLQVVIY